MMTHDSEGQETGTVIQIYATEQDAERAIAALRAAGFGADAIGILARRRGEADEVAQASGGVPIGAAHAGTVTGRLLGGEAGLIAGLALSVLPGVGWAVSTGLLVVTTLAGVAAGGALGDIVGALARVGVPDHAARRYAERFEAGDIIVVVEAGDRSADAERILGRGTGAAPDGQPTRGA